jgi:hypothetical protein
VNTLITGVRGFYPCFKLIALILAQWPPTI